THLDGVTRPQGLLVEAALPGHPQRTGVFDRPTHALAVRLDDIDEDIRMRISELHLVDDALEPEGRRRFEHGGAVMRPCCAGRESATEERPRDDSAVHIVLR